MKSRAWVSSSVFLSWRRRNSQIKKSSKDPKHGCHSRPRFWAKIRLHQACRRSSCHIRTWTVSACEVNGGPEFSSSFLSLIHTFSFLRGAIQRFIRQFSRFSDCRFHCCVGWGDWIGYAKNNSPRKGKWLNESSYLDISASARSMRRVIFHSSTSINMTASLLCSCPDLGHCTPMVFPSSLIQMILALLLPHVGQRWCSPTLYFIFLLHLRSGAPSRTPCH